jgi:ABC-type nitrate/sulfonate/bicarbonate transport system permease component
LQHRRAAEKAAIDARGGRAVGILAVVALWELAARGLTGLYVLAAPTEVALWLVENRALMSRALGETLTNAQRASSSATSPRSSSPHWRCSGRGARARSRVSRS